MDESEHRKNIIDLLFPEYWRAEAVPVLDFCLAQGYSLQEIAYASTRYGIDALILTAYTRSLGDVWGLSVTGPYTGPQWPSIINFAPTWFRP